MMAVYTTRQYRPISVHETAANDPLSVRAVNDLADGVNNYLVYCSRVGINVLCANDDGPYWASWNSTSAQNVVKVFAPIWVPDGYQKYHWTVSSKLTGAGSCVWRLYAIPGGRIYNHDAYDVVVADSSYGGLTTYEYEMGSITINSTSAAPKHDTFNFTRGDNGMVHFVLTANCAGSGYQSLLYSFAVWPEMGDGT